MSRFRQVQPAVLSRGDGASLAVGPTLSIGGLGVGRSAAGGGPAIVAGRYEVQRRLGAGSFGSVYLVRDLKGGGGGDGDDGGEDGGEMCVLKAVPVGDVRADETVHAHTEAQLLARLRHPCIVRLHASFLEGDQLCIVTELCAGGDLDARLQQCRSSGGAIPCSQVLEWLLQMLLGVHYMHSRCIIHRDLKTKNIFLSRNDVVKIGDFGVSRLLQAPADMASTFTGTPLYMSPEVLQLHAYGAKADVWSLGCVLYEVCALRPAFEATAWVQILRRILEEPAPALPPGFPPELDGLLQRMLSKQTETRPSAEELLRDPFLAEQMQTSLPRLGEQLRADGSGGEAGDEAPHVPQRKVHLETLRACAEVRAMTPRERMRVRKIQAADLHARKLQEVAEDHRLNNLRQRDHNRQRNTANHLSALMNIAEDAEEEWDRRSGSGAADGGRAAPARDAVPAGTARRADDAGNAERGDREIPEDPDEADIVYADDFDSESDETITDEFTSTDSNMLQCLQDIVRYAGDSTHH